MPISEHDCETCDARFDKLVLSPPRYQPVRGPECDSKAARQRLSVIASLSGGSMEPSARSDAGTTGT